MASCEHPGRNCSRPCIRLIIFAVHVPKPKATHGNGMEEGDIQKPEPDVPLPQTLVRIPTEQAPQQLEPQSSSGGRTGGG